jgi:AAA+ ATPase superfamily predicted ATPase
VSVKPGHVFDRDQEWQGLTQFASAQGGTATLGVVSGRRRQGKSFLLEALSNALGGFYFPSIEATEAESLRIFTSALARYTGQVPEVPFRDWNDAIPYLFRQFSGSPVLVVLDEFPFLAKAAPSLPSIIQRELGPGGSGRHSSVRLLLCGSAMSMMGKLLTGQAPLRGRAGLELVIRPFYYRDAADFWGFTDPSLSALVHAVVGGTPAYRREFARDDTPADLADFGAWVTRTVLNPQTPLFREARYLLAEETEIRDPSLYHSVLSAVALGNATSSGIANFIGRPADQVSHPLNVLEDACLLVREPDMFRSGRSTYRVIEPLITFYHAIMRGRWAELERGRADAVWQSTQPTFLAQVMGPHFESLAREFALDAGPEVFGGLPGEVGSGIVVDSAERTRIEIDVAVLAPAVPGEPRRILSLGEARWGRMMGIRDLRRLARARDLLAVKGFDARRAVLACYSGVGFEDALRDAARTESILLVDIARLYQPA